MAFVAMWRPNSGGDWTPEITLDDFKKRYDDNRKKGLQLICLRKNLNDKTFSAVWTPGDGGTPWCFGESFHKFHTLDTTHLKEHLRLGDFQLVNPSIGTVNEGDIASTKFSAFTAIWRPGSGVQAFAGDLKPQQFSAQDATQRHNGLELSCLRMQHDGTFFGLWKTGTGGNWTPPLFKDEFKTHDNFHTSQGLKLVDIDTVDGTRFVGVWHKRPEAIAWTTGTVAGIEAADKTHQKAGLHMFKLFEFSDLPIPLPEPPESWHLPPQ